MMGCRNVWGVPIADASVNLVIENSRFFERRRPEAARLRELHDEERRLATAVLFHGGDPAQLQATRNALHTERLRLKP